MTSFPPFPPCCCPTGATHHIARSPTRPDELRAETNASRYETISKDSETRDNACLDLDISPTRCVSMPTHMPPNPPAGTAEADAVLGFSSSRLRTSKKTGSDFQSYLTTLEMSLIPFSNAPRQNLSVGVSLFYAPICFLPLQDPFCHIYVVSIMALLFTALSGSRLRQF